MNRTRIQVVEDETIVARDIMDSLRDMGFDVVGSAASGRAAIELAGKTSPDIILMDIVLQGPMDGIETAAEIRRRFNIPVIFLTAYADDNILERAKLTGPFGYLIKPFEEKELRFNIEMAHYKSLMERQLRESREQYMSLVETTGAVPWELSVSGGEFTFLGPQCVRILGRGPSELPDLKSFLALVDKDDARAVKKAFDEAPYGAEPRDVEYAVVHKSGEKRWLRDTITPAIGRKGEKLLRGFMIDITKRKEAEIEREQYITELREALEEIRHLHGLLPICAWCKKIRNDNGYWQQVEVYIEEHSEAEFTHSMCPDCKKKLEEELDTT